MSATFAARASRQSIILAVTAGLHIGVLVLVASDIGPRMLRIVEFRPTEVTVLPPPPKPFVTVKPSNSGPLDIDFPAEPEPPVDIPVVEDRPPPLDFQNQTQSAAGSGPVVAVAATAPWLRTRDIRLAALINACYPSASRRMGEEGRGVARIVIDSQGRVASWAVERSSGFSRLDAAMDCVIRRLEFAAGRRDGRGVEATALLPIAFALH